MSVSAKLWKVFLRILCPYGTYPSHFFFGWFFLRCLRIAWLWSELLQAIEGLPPNYMLQRNILWVARLEPFHRRSSGLPAGTLCAFLYTPIVPKTSITKRSFGTNVLYGHPFLYPQNVLMGHTPPNSFLIL